jgi:peroxiredoxin
MNKKCLLLEIRKTGVLSLLLIIPLIIYPQKELIINGEAPFIKNGTIIHITSFYPYKPALNYLIVEDSAIIKNHKFEITLNVETAEAYILYIKGVNEPYSGVVFLQPGNCKMLLKDSILSDIEIFGNKAGIDQVLFNKEINSIKPHPEIYDFIKLYREALSAKDTLLAITHYKKIDSIEAGLKNSQQELASDWIRSNPSSLINSRVIKLYLINKLTDEQLETIYSSLSYEAKRNSWGRELELYFSGLTIGRSLPSFSLKDTSGNEVNLYDFKGKFVLLDFWASWCIPCREQTEAIMSAYNKYKKDDLVLVCISLDKIDKDWRKAIRNDLMNCINVSDLNGFDGIATQYMIKSIPANFLLDRNGVIVAKNIEIADLEYHLKKLISN